MVSFSSLSVSDSKPPPPQKEQPKAEPGPWHLEAQTFSSAPPTTKGGSKARHPEGSSSSAMMDLGPKKHIR